MVITMTSSTDQLFIELRPEMHQGLVITLTGVK